jgi:hypothetical protein
LTLFAPGSYTATHRRAACSRVFAFAQAGALA